VRWDEDERGRPRIVLSRRNLLALLAKLDGHPPDSACAIAGGHGYGEKYYEVKVEPDEVHYRDRPAPGQMIAETERALSWRSPGPRKDIIADVPPV